MLYSFEDFSLDTARRELRRGGALIALQPQVFDLLEYAIRNRERVVSKDDLLAAVWNGRIVSESTLSTRINAARSALGDSGEEQRLIRTAHGKGIRFVGVVREEAETVRKLAAIFAADVAGYSRLMGQDEVGTLRRLTACRAILDERIAAHRGRIFGSAGDSVVADFASAVDAVQCAVAVQEALAKEEQMRFRIGVHVGDVIVARREFVRRRRQHRRAARSARRARRDLHLAARCATRSATSCPMPSRIWGSRASRISHGPCASMQSAPMALLSLPPVVATAEASKSGARSTAPRLSIVVLPFANLSSDPDQEYFADGITDDLTTDLSRISGSFVIARSTAFTYKGKPVDVKQIGRELGVRYVLEGSVRRTGDQVRVNVQLIDAEGGAHVWADRFETDRRTSRKRSSEITGRLARALNLELVRDVGRRIEQEKAVDPDARDLVMRGWASYYRPRSAANRRTRLKRAFERALEIDPRSVDARVGIAAVLLRIWSGILPRDRTARLSETARAPSKLLLEAIESDPSNRRRTSTMGQLRRVQNRLTEARIEFETAISLDANDDIHARSARLDIAVSRPAARPGSPRAKKPCS